MTQMKTTGKKVSIIRNRKRQSEEVFQQLRYKLRQNNFILTEKHPDIVISIGGDGMLLSAFHKYEHQLDRVRFIGVHTGHLGFYTDYLDSEIDKLVENLKYDTGAKVSYLMINGVDFERFRGDGITVSTPTGSTAYNKSLGGAVLHPTIEALQIAEIASLNNRVYRTLGSSVIVPKKDKIEITPTRPGFHIISVDNSTYSYRNIAKVEYQIDNHKINFVASSSHTSFWNRVKDAFIGDDGE